MIAVREPRFEHCPKCGAGGLARPEPTAYECRSCGFFFHTSPAIGVGGLVLDAEGRMILLRRAHDPGKGLLGLPGGFVDPGETIEAALRRETIEEVGLEIAQWQYLTSSPNLYVYRGIGYEVLDFFFTARVGSFRAAHARNEVDGLCFLPPAEIDPSQIAFVSVRAALKLFRERASAAEF